jgi:hypothetical protein
LVHLGKPIIVIKRCLSSTATLGGDGRVALYRPWDEREKDRVALHHSNTTSMQFP